MVDVVERPVGRTAAVLREVTRDVHLQTEQEPFIVALMSGRLGAPDLARLTGQLRTVYAALEAHVLPFRDDPALRPLLDPRLDRLAAIDHDLVELAALASADATALLEPLPATSAYVDRITAASASAPRFVAHHYVRYLGDLSGGQIIAKLMRDHYGVPASALTFYAFDGLGSKGGFKTEYRRSLDCVLVDETTFDAVVDETRAAYEANRQLFVALGASTA